MHTELSRLSKNNMHKAHSFTCSTLPFLNGSPVSYLQSRNMESERAIEDKRENTPALPLWSQLKIKE
jgi:hypothetical protein